MKNQRGATILEFIFAIPMLLIIPVCIWGWVWNIIKIADSDMAVITAMFVLRVVGIFVAPLGSILGFL